MGKKMDDEIWDDSPDCFQCHGEGYVYGCGWDWQCDTYDEGEGTCLCLRRCDICNPAPPSEEQQALRRILAEALARPIEGGPRDG